MSRSSQKTSSPQARASADADESELLMASRYRERHMTWITRAGSPDWIMRLDHAPGAAGAHCETVT
ncbi:hypothetical protein G3I24_12425 [Micromonospora aurantiaca]|nr:hypothetical protein [Micromonospora aurantiaca]